MHINQVYIYPYFQKKFHINQIKNQTFEIIDLVKDLEKEEESTNQ